MLLHAIHLSNFLSFGESTQPLQLRPLNVVIGPNGSGKSNLLESIEIKARSEFSSAMHGNYTGDDIGRYVTDTVAWTVDTLRMGGIRQRNVYCEESTDPVTHRVRFNAWVNLEVSRDDFMKAKMAAADRLLKKAIRERDAEAKEKALELLERLRNEA